MNICVFDTETTSLDKPFCYNIGYIIYDTKTAAKLVEKDFVVEQVWHNPMLFTTAYYADKRPIYVDRMRKRSVKMDKFGYITQEMARDFKRYEVELAFAFNSSFDERVFEFNCDWFKCINPFDTVQIKDIRGFAHQFLTTDKYKEWCEENGKFTESGNYSTTAEDYFQFYFNEDFEEEHTALADSEIELDILMLCNTDLTKDYKAKRSIERETSYEWIVKKNKKEIFKFNAKSVTVRKAKHEISIR